MTPQEAAAKVWPLLTAETDPMPAWAALDEVMNLSGCEAHEAFQRMCDLLADRWVAARESIDGNTNEALGNLISSASFEGAEVSRKNNHSWFEKEEYRDVQYYSQITQVYADLKRPLEILAEMQSHLPTPRTQEV